MLKAVVTSDAEGRGDINLSGMLEQLLESKQVFALGSVLLSFGLNARCASRWLCVMSSVGGQEHRFG